MSGIASLAFASAGLGFIVAWTVVYIDEHRCRIGITANATTCASNSQPLFVTAIAMWAASVASIFATVVRASTWCARRKTVVVASAPVPPPAASSPTA